MKTQEEKNDMVEKLENSKQEIAEFSIFGDENWIQIDAQVAAIKENMDEEDVIENYGEEYNEDDESNPITHAALTAISWVQGDVDDDELISE